VAHERRIAREIIARVNAEFAGRIVLEPYFWEYEPFDFSKSFQAQIPNPADFDVVLCFLWSRLGSRLHSASRLPDGSSAQSGTEYEIAHALAGQKRRDGLPELHVWINRTIPPFPPDPPEVHDERIAQWRALKQFIERWTRDTNEGVFVGSFTDYKTLAEFEEFIEVKLRKIVERRVPELLEGQATEGPARRTWTEGSPFRGLEPFEFDHGESIFERTGAIGASLRACEKPKSIRMIPGAPHAAPLGQESHHLPARSHAHAGRTRCHRWHRPLATRRDEASDAEAKSLRLACYLDQNALPNLHCTEQPRRDSGSDFLRAPAAVIERIENGLLIASERQRKTGIGRAHPRYRARIAVRTRRFARTTGWLFRQRHAWPCSSINWTSSLRGNFAGNGVRPLGNGRAAFGFCHPDTLRSDLSPAPGMSGASRAGPRHRLYLA
jgi:hypothetical protein